MKNSELIAILQKLPQDLDVLIMDIGKNIYHEGEGGKGVYPINEGVTVVKIAEGNWLDKEENPMPSPIIIEMCNNDYEDIGKLSAELAEDGFYQFFKEELGVDIKNMDVSDRVSMYNSIQTMFERNGMTIDSEQDREVKTLSNTTADQAKHNVRDIKFWGNGDLFKLLGKASSKAEGWMKSTKAMEIEGVGCVVQVTTQQGENVTEAVTFVPGVKIEETENEECEVTKRKLVQVATGLGIGKG